MQADLLLTVIAWLLAGVFAPALKHKVTAWPRFLANLQAYRLVGAKLAPASGATLVVVEVAILVVLIASPLLVNWNVLLVQSALAGATVLLMVYFCAMAINVLRGRRYIDCGCGDQPTSLGIGVLARNLILAAIAAIGFFYADTATGAEVTVLVLGAALVAVGLSLYFAAEQLLANQTTHQRLWQGL